MGTHLRALSESYLMNTNMIRFRWFSYIFVFLLHWAKETPASEGLISNTVYKKYKFVMYSN